MWIQIKPVKLMTITLTDSKTTYGIPKEINMQKSSRQENGSPTLLLNVVLKEIVKASLFEKVLRKGLVQLTAYSNELALIAKNKNTLTKKLNKMSF